MTNEPVQIKYVAKITKQGDNFVLWIPKEHVKQAEKIHKEGKQVRIVIDDEW